MIQLIVGLGNPGKRYQDTRHNAGAWFIEALATDYQCQLKLESKFRAALASFSVAGHTVRIAIPCTYMNESGLAVRALCNFYKVPGDSLLIVHDELDLAAGICRLKAGGGHGGHNGLRSINQQIASQNYKRLRLGIGHPGDKNKVTDFVLSKPSQREYEAILDAQYKALAIIPQLLAGKWQDSMTQLHSEKNCSQ